MGRKNKKLTRKQRIKRRRAAISRRRQTKGRKTHNKKQAKSFQQELVDDMLPLLPLLKDGPPSPADMEQIMLTILDSADLAEEPEFEEIIIDPMLSTETFVEVGQELGIDPEKLGELSDEEREEKQVEILERTAQRLLTKDMRRQIMDGLNNLRLRLKQSGGKRKKIAKVAALQSFLSGEESDKLWPAIGLVQALIDRSLSSGFELHVATAEVMGDLDVTGDETPLSLSQKLEQSSLTGIAGSLLEKVPGMKGFLEKQVDKMWDDGVHAVYAGELYLELFTEEEIQEGFAIFRDVMGVGETGDDTQESQSPRVTEESGRQLVKRVDEYLTNLFTPERLEQLRVRIDEIAGEASFPKKWAPFILTLREYMADENAAEYEKPFLIQAFVGEIRTVGLKLSEAEEEAT